MTHRQRLLASATILLLGVVGPVVSADRTETIHFKPGATSATLEGSIKGYDGVRYILGGRSGQAISVRFEPDNTSCYFNVLPPGSDGTAIFVGSSDGNEFSRNLESSGNYVVQTYLMRNAARRNETCGYRLTVEIN